MKKTIYLFAGFFLMIVFSVSAQGVMKTGKHENGKLKYEGAVSGETKVGEWKYYHDNGLVSREGSYKNGKPYGVWKEYYRNGQVKSEGGFGIAGGKSVKHGEWITYHKNGAEETKGTYNQGRRVGTWYSYNTLGVQLNKRKY